MRYSLLLPTAVVAGGLALGCADQQSPAAPAEPAAPSLRAERIAPAFAGLLLGADASNSLLVQIGWETGVTPEDLCVDFNEAINEVGQKGQFVFTPPGGFLAHLSGRDANLVLYQFGEGILTDPCQLIGAPVLGTGTGKFVWQIIDPGPGATAIHATVQGTVDLVSGGQARLLATARVTILPDGTLLFDEERVRLTPL
jgi:hypothetical protein